MSKKIIFGILLGLALLIVGCKQGSDSLVKAAPAGGLTVNEIRDEGLAFENENGYLKICPGKKFRDLETFVIDINAEREAKYLGIATSDKVNQSDVEKSAGEQLQQKYPSLCSYD